MSRVEKASEPSMEDILSSIRKIIAEDPTGAKAPAVAIPPMSAAKSPAKPSSGAVAPRAASTPSSLDDILGLADDNSAARSVAPRPQAGKSDAATVPAAPAQERPIAAPAERPLVQPFFPPQSRDPAPAVRPAAATVHSGEPPRPDLGAFVPSRSDGGLMERINGSSAAAMRPAGPAMDSNPAAPKAETVMAKPTDAPVAVEKPASAATMAAAVAAKPAPAAAPVAAKAVEPSAAPTSQPQASEVKAEPLKADAAKAEQLKPEPARAEAPKPVPAKAEAPKPTSPDAIAAPVGNSIVTPPQRRVVTVDSPIPGTAVAVAPKPAAPTPVATTAATPPAVEPVRSMEDTVAELLRPMLRQWLDQNMPRVVEKALRVELAASAQSKNEPPKH